MWQGLAGTTHVDLGAPQLPMRQRIGGVEMDGVLEGCDRLGILAPCAQGGAAQHVESRVPWVESHGPVRRDLSLVEKHLQLLLWRPPIANMVDPCPGIALQGRNRVRVKGVRPIEVPDRLPVTLRVPLARHVVAAEYHEVSGLRRDGERTLRD